MWQRPWRGARRAIARVNERPPCRVARRAGSGRVMAMNHGRHGCTMDGGQLAGAADRGPRRRQARPAAIRATSLHHSIVWSKCIRAGPRRQPVTSGALSCEHRPPTRGTSHAHDAQMCWCVAHYRAGSMCVAHCRAGSLLLLGVWGPVERSLVTFKVKRAAWLA